MYDAEIAYTDEMIGQLTEYIHSNHDNTIVVVTADHGELLGEHGLLSHRYVLSDAVTRVPLVISGLKTELQVSENDVIQHADVMKTLLEIAEGVTDGMLGVDLRTESREFAVSQRGPVDFDNFYKYNDDFDASAFHNQTLTALRTDQYRYQESDDGSDLFTLSNEEKDVTDKYPDIVSGLSQNLEEWTNQYGKPISSGSKAKFSGAVQRQLQDLGYL